MKKYFFILIIFCFTYTIFAQENKNTLVLASLFGENMVLQQKSNVAIWGKAKAGEDINIVASWGAKSKTKAKTDGSWNAKLKTPKAGGPFSLSIKAGDESVDLKNVFVGEVWICSGQSNMEMPLNGLSLPDTVLNFAQEIKEATNAYLKLFTVKRVVSGKPLSECTGSWSECNPQTAKVFSATAYFFGRKLSQELKIPIGLIHSSWGGTPAEAWTSAKEVSKFDEYKETIKKIAEGQTDFTKYNEWLITHQIIDVSKKEDSEKFKNLEFGDAQCAETSFNDTDWHSINVPGLWENGMIGNFDGVIWLRKKINVPKSWLGKELLLELASIDDMDRTYVNGVKVGSYETTGFYNTHRAYPVFPDLIKDTSISIAVRVVDNMGGGGIWGNASGLKISIKGSNENISLVGDWKFLPVAQYVEDKFYVFGVTNEFYSRPSVPVTISSDTPASLFNGMIAPLIPYTIKGIIWYQGEANVGRADQYKKLFPAMIKSWREEWKQGNFPFYYVQIAPWYYGNVPTSQYLREAQLFSLSTPNTGMAVTLDIGSNKTIHPPYKQKVGDRLAFVALAKSYGKKIEYSGPVYKSMKVVGSKIELSFERIGGGLVLIGKDGKNNFQIAGEDKIFKKADVVNNGKKLTVSSSEVLKPVAVRYGWEDYLDGSLFNKAGLPASSFRTDDWKE